MGVSLSVGWAEQVCGNFHGEHDQELQPPLTAGYLDIHSEETYPLNFGNQTWLVGKFLINGGF